MTQEMIKTAPVETSPGLVIEMAEILKLLPHRYPFLFIDRAEDYRAGESIVGVKCVTMNEPFFLGHFPGNPVMPGVLIAEAMAQTGGVLMSKTLDADLEDKTIFFMSLETRFRHPVRPGDVLRMPVQVTHTRGGVFKFRGEAFVGDRLAAQADFSAMVVDNR
jgi:3-hydroxyacyl-[acyl-carrier-protein] dehydratase